jgi:hypothetical protein
LRSLAAETSIGSRVKGDSSWSGTISTWDSGTHLAAMHVNCPRESSCKSREAQMNGWTLWSFRHRRSLNQWFALIRSAEPNSVYVLCSYSPHATDPKGKVSYCKKYQLVDSTEWRDVPSTVSVPHPIGKGQYSSAFLVKRVLPLAQPEIPPVYVQWYSTGQNAWRGDSLPTRGEYLIRRNGGVALRPIRAVLELAYPYLALLRV